MCKVDITIIAAISENRALGKNNNLIWRIPGDLKRFKQLTMGHTVIMGRKTYESIGAVLPNRKNIILSKNKSYKVQGAILCQEFDEAINLIKKDNKVFIIGGGKIYATTMAKAQRMELTMIHKTCLNADTFFPRIVKEEWTLVAKRKNSAQESHPAYSFLTYCRK